MTVFGDSVQASFGFAPRAVRHLGRGLRLRMEADVCRRLASPGCLGGSPPSALDVARSLGTGLGEAVIVNVGYNDDARVYDVPAMLATLRRAGVRAVVWVTIRERRPYYRPLNDRIRAAARGGGRGGMVVRVADWDAYSAGRPWFASDGLHLTTTGAMGLAGLLRERLLATMAEAGVSLPGRPAATAVPLQGRVARIAGDGGVLWVQARSGRLSAFDDDRGGRLPGRGAVAPGEALVSDGGGAWLRDSAGTLTRPAAGADGFRGGVVAGVGASPARAGAVLWSVAPCVAGPACPGGRVLRATVLGGAARDVALPPGAVRAVAADRRALWLLVERGGAAVVERRDPVSGMLVRGTRLPAWAARGALAAGRGAAWVLPRGGRLVRVTRAGGVRVARTGVRAIAAAGTELWAVVAGGRTVVRLDPAGRLRARTASPVRLSGRMALTRGNVWVLARSGREAVRVPRPGA